MMRLSQAAHAVDARLLGSDLEFEAVSIDSRTVRRGDIFIALRGERFDGHAFIAQAAAAGAAAAMVEQPVSEKVLPQIVVEDTSRALGRLAHYWRRQFAIPLVALTGSN